MKRDILNLLVFIYLSGTLLVQAENVSKDQVAIDARQPLIESLGLGDAEYILERQAYAESIRDMDAYQRRMAWVRWQESHPRRAAVRSELKRQSMGTGGKIAMMRSQLEHTADPVVKEGLEKRIATMDMTPRERRAYYAQRSEMDVDQVAFSLTPATEGSEAGSSRPSDASSHTRLAEEAATPELRNALRVLSEVRELPPRERREFMSSASYRASVELIMEGVSGESAE
ncbi:hypothetical protein [Cerasicoccus frondis]|uniref:hypothetical protein n=1 Tax=Cerasicoccus frondis TaxID=490090 RepID=UPI002852D2F0|nr:hypothetical protein [Cerasicoccus frondis]